MELPVELQRIPEDTTVVCRGTLEEWITAYLETGLHDTDWNRLHWWAMEELWSEHGHFGGGTGHGFAMRNEGNVA